jgi:hydrogenase nickel incorporation protein HypB
MCANCGCQGDKAVLLDLETGETTPIDAAHSDAGAADHADDHADDHGGAHRHAHGAGAEHHVHSHHGERSGAVDIVNVEARILAKNDALAQQNRAWFAGREILALNLVSSPGAGKTTLLERTIRDLAGEMPLGVIEGDQATANDGERIRRAGAAVVQVNTGTGCHLDATMVTRALSALRPAPGTVVLIENVGNLVCPALFDLGERAKVVIFSVTDGEDKPLKYPHMFRAAGLVLVSKTDLLPHLDFSIAEAIANLQKINPAAMILSVSAQSGEGMKEWYDWLRGQFAAARQFALA